jgi:hypothetical protein
MGEKICHFLFAKLLKILYLNPAFKMQHAIATDMCTFIHKELTLFNNWFEGMVVLNVFKNIT